MAKKKQDPTPRPLVRISFRRSQDYRVYIGSSVWGGPVPGHDAIVMNVCTEQIALPVLVVHEVDESGIVDTAKIAGRQMNADIEREVQCGIQFSIEEAENVGKWLLQQVKNWKENK